MITASVALRSERRYCQPRTAERNETIADMRAMGEELGAIAAAVGTTIRTVERVLADHAAAGRSESCRLSERQETEFALAMKFRTFDDVNLKPSPRLGLYARLRLPP